MNSSSGSYFIGLDHVKALAAFMVFTWHFTHAMKGYPVPFNYVPAIMPFSLLDEGHTGVALFMSLSGYLFAKLLAGKSIVYKSFLYNRLLRLAPLLFVVIIIVGIKNLIYDKDVLSYAYSILKSPVFPALLPNGGWAIMVELHYYLLMPFILYMFRKSKFMPLSIIIFAILIRCFIYCEKGEIQNIAYFTILGRIDQFVLGMLMYYYRALFAYRHLLIVIIFICFVIFYWCYDIVGGFYQDLSGRSSSPLWIILTTIEGFVYAVFIAWYDNSFSHSTTGVSKFIGRIGEYSYFIYLFHFFIVFKAARFVNEHIMNISNLYLACLWSCFVFILMIPFGYLSLRFIEVPFLKLRKPYIAA